MGRTRMSAASHRFSANGARVSVLSGGRSYILANVDNRNGIGG